MTLDPKDKILISGFHSALGEAGYIVLRHLAVQEGVRPIGSIMSPLTPPHVFVGGGRLLLPIELYSYGDSFLLLFPRVQPHRADLDTIAANSALSSQPRAIIGGVPGLT
jgi:predicted ATP-grasp superfamily ATP-dependent carboligase